METQGIEARDQRRPGVFTQEEKQQRQEAILQKYGKVSVSAQGKFKYQTGQAGARALGYDDALLERLPEDVLDAFCGVGNPFSLGEITRGSNVLDIGCGAGFDLMVARGKTGTEGRVCGVDLSPAMIERTRTNLGQAGCDGIEVYRVQSEKLPFADGTFDVVISNGVINLSPAKAELFSEIHRVLKPGGRLRIADMMLDKELPPHLAGSLEAWSR
ncbi:MAG: methyltransferase domain-containing protein [Desulfopila sp.]